MARKLTRIPVIPPLQIRNAYREPELAQRRERPNIAYDTPIIDVQLSIRHTLWYLSACEVPYEGGRLQQFDDDRAETVIWPLLKQRLGLRSEVEYYFDAEARLVKRMVQYSELGGAQRGKFMIIELRTMPYDLRLAVLTALQARRLRIQQKWTTRPARVPVPLTN